MLIRQSKNSYIRIHKNILAHITNQLTKQSSTFTGAGVDFLAQIKRYPRSLEDIISTLCDIYDIDKETIQKDFLEFAEDLVSSKFIVMGENSVELDTKDLCFNYATEVPYSSANKDKEINDKQSYYSFDDEHVNKLLDTLSLDVLQIELTNRCNERCIHCYIPNSIKNKGQDLSIVEFKKIIDKYVEMGGIKISLSGGEALLNKDIVRMLYYCREKDLQIVLLTNLISLNDEHLRVLKEVNVECVKVSLYAMSSKIHDSITTVKGSFRQTKAAIEKLHKANIRCEIQCPIIKANKGEYSKVFEFAKSLNMKCNLDYGIFAQNDLNTSNLSNRLSISELEPVIINIMRINPSFYTPKNYSIDDVANLPFCSGGVNSLGISANGNVIPCPGWDGYVVGNVFKESLDDIFYNSKRLKELRGIRRSSVPRCIECEARNYCDFCFAHNFNENNGNLLIPNQYFCDVAFLTKTLIEEQQRNKTIETILAELEDSPIYNLSLSSKELFHSNFLAWLGSNAPTKSFFVDVMNKMGCDLIFSNNDEWTVEREDKNFDLCIKQNGKYILVIENKIKSIPRKKQLDNYIAKVNKKTHLLLLTLVEQFPNMQNVLPWKIKTYKDLSIAMTDCLKNSGFEGYLKEIIEDYINYISKLVEIQKLLQNQTSFVSKCTRRLGKLSDLFEKIKFSNYAMELHEKISCKFNNVVVFDSSTSEQQKKSIDAKKLYIKVDWGYTHSNGNSGLVDIAIPVSDLTNPKIQYGIIDAKYVIKIQVQGDKYCHAIETFDNNPVGLNLVNIGKSLVYTSQIKFFSSDPLNLALDLPHYGNINIFEPKVYPINKERIPSTNWPFASYNNKQKKTSFIYQSMKIKHSAPVNMVIDNIVNEIEYFLDCFSNLKM